MCNFNIKMYILSVIIISVINNLFVHTWFGTLEFLHLHCIADTQNRYTDNFAHKRLCISALAIPPFSKRLRILALSISPISERLRIRMR